jgi:HlyD family secretion protein
MKSPWPKRIAAGACLALVAGGAWWALREQPAQVDIATIAQGPMKVTIRQEGVTRVSDIYAVSAPIAGHLSRTVLEEGDRVVAGTTVIAARRPNCWPQGTPRDRA